MFRRIVLSEWLVQLCTRSRSWHLYWVHPGFGIIQEEENEGSE